MFQSGMLLLAFKLLSSSALNAVLSCIAAFHTVEEDVHFQRQELGHTRIVCRQAARVTALMRRVDEDLHILEIRRLMIENVRMRIAAVVQAVLGGRFRPTGVQGLEDGARQLGTRQDIEELALEGGNWGTPGTSKTCSWG